MDKPTLYWILDLVPLMALLLVSAFMYAYRHRRGPRLQTRSVRKPSGPGFTEFSARSMETAKFRGMGAREVPSPSEPFHFSGNGDAWNTLHARLIALSEREHARLIALSGQDERG
jgi:hypothetical protein